MELPKINNLHCYLYFVLINLVCVSARVAVNGGISPQAGGPYVHAEHHKFVYRPPRHIIFMCSRCLRPTVYPVYHGTLPTYVYQIRETNSGLGDLLTGLALYNLAKSPAHYNYYNRKPRSDEKCSLQIFTLREELDFQETLMPCDLVSSFVNDSGEMERFTEASVIVDVNSTQVINATESRSVVIVDLKKINELECVIWHNLTLHKERKIVPCALLKEYSKSIKPWGVPFYIWLPTLIGIVIIMLFYCRVCCFRRKQYKEEEPLNQQPGIGYASNSQVD